jgi:phosphoglycolate phosphatase
VRRVLRCVYTDLDATLLGPGGSLLAAADGSTSLIAARAVEACARADVELCVMTGRKQESAAVVARMLGQRSYVFEVGAGYVLEGEEHWLTGDWVPEGGRTVAERISDAGAVQVLLDHFGPRLEFHAPYHRNREVSHLLRGDVDVDEANTLLAGAGLETLRLLDNGPAHHWSDQQVALARHRVYHLLPAGASKVRGVAAHMQARGYAPEETLAVGDSREDLAVASVVGTFWLVANALDGDPGIRGALAEHPNARVCEEAFGAGVYEAVVSTLAARA